MTTVGEDLADAAWGLYCLAFDELRVAAAQRHVMHRHEFDEVMTDKRVTKFIVEDGEIRGLATRTNDLEAVPLISPDYFQARYPRHFASGRIFYVGFMAVHPDYHGTGVFVDMVTDMSADAAAVGGIMAMDFCRITNKQYQLPQAALRVGRTHNSELTATLLDEQSYWAYEFPAVS